MWQETNEIPTDENQISGKGKATNGNVYELWRLRNLWQEYKEQFRQMTGEEIERHIGLEKVRNVMEGFDRERHRQNKTDDARSKKWK